jgi:cytochrome c2
MMASPLLPVIVFAMTVLAAAAGNARAGESSGLYFERCGRCHGTAEALFDKKADLRDGIVVGRRSRRDLRVFLGSHFARRDGAEVESVYMELLRFARGGGRFRQQCSICHISAERLARESMVLRNGELFGRYSGRRIVDFLQGHGRLETPADAAFFDKVLRRNLPER